ncbi:hypothetical protein Tco_0581653 [Tanacetum coccineum]
MSKLLYTRFTKLIINQFLSCNKSIPRRSNSELHSAQDDQPITRLSNTVKAKEKESAKDKIIDELEEQRMSSVKNGRGKGFMCYGDQAVNVLKKDVVPRKTRSLTIAEEIIVDTYAEWGQKLKGPGFELSFPTRRVVYDTLILEDIKATFWYESSTQMADFLITSDSDLLEK